MREFAGDPEKVPPEYRAMVGWEGYRAAMRELAALAEEHRFEVLMTTFSTSFSPRHRRVLRLGRELGFATLDVGEVYRDYLAAHGHDDYRTSPLALSPENMHPSPLGHEIAARVIFRFLCEHEFPAELAGCQLAPWEGAPPGRRPTGSAP